MAQSWPSRTINAVVPFGPGTSIEAAARPIFEQMARALGQPIIIEHRPGAGGTTGAAAVARATPDGHTLLVYSSSFAISHSIHKNRRYDTLGDFIPVLPFGVQPNVIVTAPSRGFKTLAELIEAAKAKPGSMNYASIGVGSAPHIAAERFRLSAGFQAQNVPFRGPPEALTETLTGRIDFYFVPLGTALPLLKEGKLQALAVSTSKRATALPDVPTTTELGLKDLAFDLWIGLFAPAGTPPAGCRTAIRGGSQSAGIASCAGTAIGAGDGKYADDVIGVRRLLQEGCRGHRRLGKARRDTSRLIQANTKSNARL